ncbi:CPBP family intramembrane glutamic endopeptidase [Paramicrobacterium chengjingii]|uniref:CPBP family intramembrane glutamic endopeptidase n=1 Tax=Paramicrobacterium chengjingii TaxID=2769067 RepID=UPI001422C8F3|nr:type II CAAX endopeptidase family protein [Microbacterium chengjingii]
MTTSRDALPAHSAVDGASRLQYHRLARSARSYRWWRPLLVAGVGAGFYGTFMLGALLWAGVAALLSPGFAAAADAFATSAHDVSDPLVLAVTLLSLIALLPSLFIAQLLVGTKPVGLLSSVAGHLRWRMLARSLRVAFAVFAIAQCITVAISAAQGEPLAQHVDASTALPALVISVLLVPFQAAAEEYVFRGFLMQTIGGWLRHPLFSVLLPMPVFVVAHGYDPLGQASVAAFAIVAGWLTIRTGGLEAAIGLHVVNNLAVFGLGALGLGDVNATSLGPIDLVVSIATMAVYAAVVVWQFRRGAHASTRDVPESRSLASTADRQPGMPG